MFRFQWAMVFNLMIILFGMSIVMGIYVAPPLYILSINMIPLQSITFYEAFLRPETPYERELREFMEGK